MSELEAELEAVFQFMNDGESRLLIEPPPGSRRRYLSSFAVQADGLDLVRLGFQLHTRDVRDLHTICTRNSRVGVSCGLCGYEFHSVEPVEALTELADHTTREHPRDVPQYLLRDLWPDTRKIERRFW